MKRVVGVNTEDDGVARTLKASYFKTGCVDFIYTNAWGATGAMEIYETK